LKQLILKLLNMLGLVTAGRYAVAVKRLHDADVRAKKLAKTIDGLRADTHTWKTKANESAARLKVAEKEATRHAQAVESHKVDAERHRREIEKHQREAEKLRTDLERQRKRDADLELLRKRLEEAERALGIAREHLMAVDVKLDILEGAANVLDSRTRVIAQHAGETNAPA
jgi:chromosome segregation ATPase